MIPILYSKTETTFTHNGLGHLKDAVKAIVTEERNGVFELSLQYPVTGNLYPQITEGSIVKAKANDTSQLQLFRIYQSSKPINGIVTYAAEHISYDLNGLPLAGFSIANATPQAAINQALNDTPFENNFSATSDISTINQTTIKTPCSVRAVLGGQAGSILDVWGGEYEFDNFTVKLHRQRGSDNGITVEYGKNLTDIKQERNIAECYTHLMPYAVWNRDNGDGTTSDVYVYLDEKVIAFPNAENIGHSKAHIMDFSDKFGENEIPTQAALRIKANSYIASNPNLGVPKINITVSFVQLWQTEEYKNIALLERVGLCDIVNVKFSKIGITAKAKVIKTVYDSLKESYETITLGDAKSNFADTINKYRSDISDIRKTIKTNQSQATAAWTRAIAEATAAITGQTGGYVVLNPSENPQEILILDSPDIETAQNVWRWNSGGLGFSSSGYNGTYTTAITMDGQIVADFISAGEIDGGLIRAGSISADAITANTLKTVFNSISNYIEITSNALQLKLADNNVVIFGMTEGYSSPVLQFFVPNAGYKIGCELTGLGLRFWQGFAQSRTSGMYYGNERLQTNGGHVIIDGGGSFTYNNQQKKCR